jgi:hypothetical protein
MAVKHKRRSAAEKAAFQRFVELVRPIEAVRHVAIVEEEPLEVITYVTGRSLKVYEDISEAEDQVIESFPELLIEFHVYGVDSLTRDQQSRWVSLFGRDSDA